ncbi:MAG: DUF3575 domain-containing protein [Bacteroidales bacterium]|nr:DUF3575 domain-containing protein [Bacteroidales bacterium]
MAVGVVAPTAAAFQADTVNLDVHFRSGTSDIDEGYMNNGDNLRKFTEKVDSVLYDPDFEVGVIAIRGAASPEGNTENNFRLSLNRGNSIRNYILAHSQLPPEKVTIIPIGENWEGLEIRLLEIEQPWKDRALEIIRETPTDGDNPETRKELLKQLDGGNAWKWLLQNVYPDLRNAGGGVRLVIQPKITVPDSDTFIAADEFVLEEDNLTVDTLTIPAIIIPVDTFFINDTPLHCDTLALPDTSRQKGIGLTLAVKTNLLSDLVLAPNVEIEIPINNKWSVCLDWTCPWWLLRGNSLCEQLLSTHAQGKRYFGNRERLGYFTGWFAGVQGGLGYYDFQVPEKGAQGEFADIGLGGGYSLRLGEYLNLEFELGLGILYTQYRVYTPIENYSILLYRETKEMFWMGPTRAKVSLVWRIGRKCRSDER